MVEKNNKNREDEEDFEYKKGDSKRSEDNKGKKVKK